MDGWWLSLAPKRFVKGRLFKTVRPFGLIFESVRMHLCGSEFQPIRKGYYDVVINANHTELCRIMTSFLMVISLMVQSSRLIWWRSRNSRENGLSSVRVWHPRGDDDEQNR